MFTDHSVSSYVEFGDLGLCGFFSGQLVFLVRGQKFHVMAFNRTQLYARIFKPTGSSTDKSKKNREQRLKPSKPVYLLGNSVNTTDLHDTNRNVSLVHMNSVIKYIHAC